MATLMPIVIHILSGSVSLSGYRFYRRDSLGRGGGVGLYVRSLISCRVFDDLLLSGECEQLWITFRLLHFNIAVGVFYRPPSGSFAAFMSNFEINLSRVSLMYDYVTILGDFNLDLLNDSNGTVNQFLALIESYNFTQIINEPSRVTAATATLLDLILVSDVDRVRSHSVKPMLLLHCWI
ncbi:hypothetical protein QE152_g27846 [Popillia japonica]|uniref:Endonuclease/exonuclease/phosphatase domain-containing protein n=1 Tax=Popillia japonica TaxID=7064 RepID=A0AAW1JJI6_POPJA